MAEAAARTAPPQPPAPAPVDGFAVLRHNLHRLAEQRGDWAGIPMPIDGTRLVIEPRYPNAAALSKIGAPAPDADAAAEAEAITIRNRFWSWRWRAVVVIWQTPDGRVHWVRVPAVHSLAQQVSTLDAADAWGIEQEARALELLAGMLRPRQYRQYILTGAFIEASPRSGVRYMFRKLRPTVAFVARDDDHHILCALCLHPIAYYEGSWAGAMCPTDDVIAHLALMRGDEAMFWRRANQHPAWRPEAGI